MTVHRLFGLLYELGWSYEDILTAPYSHLVVATRALARQKEERQMHTLSIVNHIRSVVGGDPIDPSQPQKTTTKDKEGAEQLMDRVAKTKGATRLHE